MKLEFLTIHSVKWIVQFVHNDNAHRPWTCPLHNHSVFFFHFHFHFVVVTFTFFSFVHNYIMTLHIVLELVLFTTTLAFFHFHFHFCVNYTLSLNLHSFHFHFRFCVITFTFFICSGSELHNKVTYCPWTCPLKFALFVTSGVTSYFTFVSKVFRVRSIW